MDTGTSPPARRLDRPRWLDLRLLAGVLIVLVSVVIGARVVSAAERGEVVWSAAHDLSAGTTLREGDLVATSVRLADSTERYVDAGGAAPTGYVLVRDVSAGELIPVTAVSEGEEASSRRLISVPVAPDHFPAGLARGQRVDVYVTAAVLPGALTDEVEPELALTDVAVSQVAGGSDGFGPASGSVGVVLEVDEDEVAAVVAAVATGTIQLVGLPGS